ncbi:MAG: N-acetylmuramoyl-L-alanine amidase [Phycisphaerae bacterium]|jgi:N-acetylmuramoyl-L-alanine amidase
MKKKVLCVLLFAVASMGLSGCQQASKRTSSGSLTQDELINVYYLAGKLEMSVSEITDRKVIFTGGGNTVGIYPKEDYVYLNDKYFGTLGKTKKIDGMLHVRSSLLAQINSEITGKTTVQIQPRITPIPAPKPVLTPWTGGGGRIIVVDAGHGGKDSGAISPNGFYEKTVNLDVALALTDLLRKQGFRVIMTRSSDVFIELEERANIGTRNKAVLFISIHADSCATSSINGFSVYVARRPDWQAMKLADSINTQMSKTGIPSRGRKEADYRVLKLSQCPAVLIEMGYLSNYWEANQLRDKNMQQKIATAITGGVINYFGGR